MKIGDRSNLNSTHILISGVLLLNYQIAYYFVHQYQRETVNLLVCVAAVLYMRRILMSTDS